MFTRDFSRLRFVSAALAVTALVHAGVTAGLDAISRHAEVALGVYPFWHEDCLRPLVPSLYEGRGGNRILLTGNSDAKELLLYERFNEAFPGETAFQGALGSSLFNDVLLGLEYTERAYGTDALPRTLVVGVSPRFTADIGITESFPSGAIERFSAAYRVEPSAEGPRLVAKSAWDALRCRLRFWGKQQPRYRIAIAAHVVRWLARAGLSGGLVQHVARQSEPYFTNFRQPLPATAVRNWIRHPGSYWGQVHAWDPATDADRIRRRLGRLANYAREHGIELYAVNVPEIVWAREGYQPGRYEGYRKLLREGLGDTPVLDLWELLRPDEFQDTSHPTRAGAERATARVIEFIKSERSKRHVAGRGSP